MNEALIQWPEHVFGLPLLQPYELRRQKNYLTTKMASGRTRIRRINKNVPTVMSAEWSIANENRDTFAGFIEHALQGGLKPFQMRIRVGDCLRPHSVRFLVHPLDSEKPGITKTKFKSTVEIRLLHQATEEESVNHILSPYTLEEFVAATDMNRYYTESWKNVEQ